MWVCINDILDSIIAFSDSIHAFESKNNFKPCHIIMESLNLLFKFNKNVKQILRKEVLGFCHQNPRTNDH
jgi:hypothetical protein